MGNTVVQRTLKGGADDRYVVRLVHIISDGTEESNTVVYDNSTLVNDVLKGSLVELWATGADSLCRLSWDQTTDSPAITVNPVHSVRLDFEEFGGITNPGATGATGDLLLNTANLDSGDEVTLILKIKQS